MLLVQCAVFGYLWTGYRTGRGFAAPATYDSALDLKIGEPAPPLSVETLSGGEIDLLRQPAARPRILLFDATCASCAVSQLHTLQRLGRAGRLAAFRLSSRC